MIKILRNNIKLDFKSFLFPGGECHIKLNSENLKFRYETAPINIIARINSMNDFFELALAKDALERWIGECRINLYCFWMPYGQQDKVFVHGEPLSVKVMANLINSLSFSRVIIADPHSDIPAAVFDRVTIIRQDEIINKFQFFIERVLRGVIFVSPDAGGNKKTSLLASYFAHQEFVRADKKRNLATGEILETLVLADDLYKRDVVIADDIAKGGQTFIELAKALRSKNCGKIILYVTHGIFSKGTDVLYKGGIDEIFTTNSFYDVLPSGVDIKPENILNLEESFIK